MRRLLLALLVLCALWAPASASSTSNTLGSNPYNPIYTSPGGAGSWSCGLASVAASLTQCQAAPGYGLRLYVTDITVQTTTATAGSYQLRYGTGTNCATGTTVLYPAFVGAFTAPVISLPPQYIGFQPPLAVGATQGANQALCVFGTAVNTIAVSIQGFTSF